INLDVANTDAQKALVGRQAADLPLFGIETDDCKREYTALKKRGVEFEGEPERRSYGTGVRWTNWIHRSNERTNHRRTNSKRLPATLSRECLAQTTLGHRTSERPDPLGWLVRAPYP